MIKMDYEGGRGIDREMTKCRPHFDVVVNWHRVKGGASPLWHKLWIKLLAEGVGETRGKEDKHKKPPSGVPSQDPDDGSV